jgi:hypothetical protein
LADADREKVRLALWIEPNGYEGDPTEKDLARWYEKMGFERESGGWYVRQPR